MKERCYTKIFGILVISLCFLHLTIAANLTLREMFQRSKDAIESNNVGDIDKVLNKYYFTDIKGKSTYLFHHNCVKGIVSLFY